MYCMKIRNNTPCDIYDEFTQKHSSQIIQRCPLLAKFNIDILLIDEYIKQRECLPHIENVDREVMSCYIVKECEDISRTKAGIVINQSAISSLNLTNAELMAVFAHEIGHIAFFFHSNKNNMDSVCEEIYADSYATSIGLGNSLCNVLENLKPYYPDGTSILNLRIKFLKDI